MPPQRIIEIRTYRVKRGQRHEFGRRMAAVAPMLARHGIEVIGHGPSLVDEGGQDYVLLRAFDSRADRDRLEEAFYGGDEWRQGPRAGILELIEAYHTVVLTVTEDAIRALANSLSRR